MDESIDMLLEYSLSIRDIPILILCHVYLRLNTTIVSFIVDLLS